MKKFELSATPCHEVTVMLNRRHLLRVFEAPGPGEFALERHGAGTAVVLVLPHRALVHADYETTG